MTQPVTGSQDCLHKEASGYVRRVDDPAGLIEHFATIQQGASAGLRGQQDPQGQTEHDLEPRRDHGVRQGVGQPLDQGWLTDKRAYIYAGTTSVAAIRIWLRDLTRQHPPDTP